MDMQLKDRFLELWRKYFGNAELPLAFWYADDPQGTEKVSLPKGHRCFLENLAAVRQGKSLRFDEYTVGCAGGKRYLGFTDVVMPNFEYFLSCGIPGKLEGERYKKTPELVKEFDKRQETFNAPSSSSPRPTSCRGCSRWPTSPRRSPTASTARSARAAAPS